MKTLPRFHTLIAALATVSLVTPVPGVVSIDFVVVGNPGNAADPGGGGYGSVGYTYRISKNETTISQYAEFLNAVAKTDPYALYSPSMSSDANIAGINRSGSSGKRS